MVRAVTHTDTTLRYSYVSEKRQIWESESQTSPSQTRSSAKPSASTRNLIWRWSSYFPPHSPRYQLLAIVKKQNSLGRRKIERRQQLFLFCTGCNEISSFFLFKKINMTKGQHYPKAKTLRILFRISNQDITKGNSSWVQHMPCASSPQHRSYCISLPTPSRVWWITQIRRALTKGPGSVSRNAEPGTTRASVSHFSGQRSELNPNCQLRGFIRNQKPWASWLPGLQRHGNLSFGKWQKKKEFKPTLSQLGSRRALRMLGLRLSASPAPFSGIAPGIPTSTPFLFHLHSLPLINHLPLK